MSTENEYGAMAGPRSTAELVALLHLELRKLAAAKMRHERPDHTLSPTELVHEVFLRLDGEGHPWHSRGQFFKAAAEAMRRILIESGKAKKSTKRGGGRVRVSLESEEAGWVEIDVDGLFGADLEKLNAAMEELRAASEDVYWVVMLRFFAGMTAERVAEVLEIADRTVHRHWSAARLFLFERCR